jgi:prefoldin subunit 5
LLTSLALENSAEYKFLQQKEALGNDLIANQSAKAWTAWLTTNPVSLVQNVFGGGRRQEIELAIAQLNLELTRIGQEKEALTDSYRQSVTLLISELTRLQREITRTKGAQRTLQTRLVIARAAYRQGQGSHSAMISLEDKANDIEEAIDRLQEQLTEIEQELKSLCDIGNNYGG